MAAFFLVGCAATDRQRKRVVAKHLPCLMAEPRSWHISKECRHNHGAGAAESRKLPLPLCRRGTRSRHLAVPGNAVRPTRHPPSSRLRACQHRNHRAAPTRSGDAPPNPRHIQNPRPRRCFPRPFHLAVYAVYLHLPAHLIRRLLFATILLHKVTPPPLHRKGLPTDTLGGAVFGKIFFRKFRGARPA